MDLPLNNVLNLTKEEIENSKIEFNMQAGSGGQPFLDRWLKHSEDEKKSGTCTDCSYWGWYGKQRNFYPGQWVFSFARMTDDEWLLISAAEIVDVPADEWATVNVLERFVPLFGRLIIKCRKGNTFSRYVFNLSKYLEQASVKEILSCLYSGENFEGYDRVHLPYHRLADIFNGTTVNEDNVRGCIFISTADHFSKPAKDYASNVINKNIVDTFDLIDCKEFLKMADLVRDKLPDVWTNLLKL